MYHYTIIKYTENPQALRFRFADCILLHWSSTSPLKKMNFKKYTYYIALNLSLFNCRKIKINCTLEKQNIIIVLKLTFRILLKKKKNEQ